MRHFIVFLMLCLGMVQNASGEVFNGPTDLSLKIYDTLTINGPAKLKLIKGSSLEVHGTLEFHRLAISGKASVTGTMTGDHGKFGQLTVVGPMTVDHMICEDLTVTGPVTADSVVINNNTNIIGPLDARQSDFKNLTVNAEKIILDDVDVETITITGDQKNQTLVLKGKTTVTRDITFTSGTGIIQKEGSKVVVKGNVKGAVQR